MRDIWITYNSIYMVGFIYIGFHIVKTCKMIQTDIAAKKKETP